MRQHMLVVSLVQVEHQLATPCLLLMEGLKIAAASANGGSDADSTAMGASYTMAAGGASVTVAVASSTVGANAAADVTQNHYGISITSGDSQSWLNQTAWTMVQQLITHQQVLVVHTQWEQSRLVHTTEQLQQEQLLRTTHRLLMVSITPLQQV